MKANRETLIAILFGFFVGFGVAAGIFFLPKLRKSVATTDLPAIMHNGKNTPSPTEARIALTSPPDNFGTSQNSVSVIGKSKPNAIIVLSTVLIDKVTEADATGNFKADVSLTVGPQDLTITAYQDGNIQDTIKRTIYVVPEDKTNEQ